MKMYILLAAIACFSVAAFASDTIIPAADADAKYNATIEGRTAEILKVLALSDTNQAARVHDIIIAQYRALNAWHDGHDAKLKAAKGDTNAVADIRASLKEIHDRFVGKLAEILTPEQVDAVKDKMTYGKVQFTYKGYLVQYPNLNETNKAEILKILKQAREEAMDGGSSQEKTAIFQRYKGRVNNYLSHQGIHPEKQKADAAPAITNSAPAQQ
jgi:hypothetical protein